MDPRIKIDRSDNTVEIYWPMDQETEYLDAAEALKRKLVTMSDGKLTLIKK